MSAGLHRFHVGCASLPRPCCGSDIRPVLCCCAPAVRASLCAPLRLRLRLWTAWRGGFSPGACRPLLRTPAAQCALPLSDRRWAGQEEGRDCKERLQVHSRRARMLRCRDSLCSRSLSSATDASLSCYAICCTCAASDTTAHVSPGMWALLLLKTHRHWWRKGLDQ